MLVLSECASKLQKLRAMESLAPRKEILTVLGRLEAVSQLTPEMLSKTGIGLEVNHKFLRKHPDAQVMQHAARLVHQWKAQVCGGCSSAEERKRKGAPLTG